MPEFHGKRITNSRILDSHTMHRWKSLTLNRTQVDDSGISQVCQTASQLKEVHISSDIITDLSMPHICALPLLKTLLLDGVPHITDVGIAHLGTLLQLRELSLKGTQLSDEGVRSLLNLSHVWSLSLADTKITDSGVSQLGHMRSLSILHLERVRIQGWGLCNLHITGRLYLYLDGCPLRDVELIRFLNSHDQLEILSLSNSTVSDTAMVAIAALPELTQLRLECTRITDEGVEHLCGHANLSTLYLANTAVSADMIARLKSHSANNLIIYS